MKKRVLRVFPRRTRATPDDSLCRVAKGPGLLDVDVDEVHVSVAFSWDLDAAKRLADQWSGITSVRIGGPATGQRSEEFVPGLYLKRGYVITSRGCPNQCWHCSVWRREGKGVRELPVQDGYNILDDNLLACSRPHIEAVFQMLQRQAELIEFSGGLEAARLEDWHIDWLTRLRLKSAFFAYDGPEDLEPLRCAGEKLARAGLITPNNVVCRCYVLVGYPKDTFGRADQRLYETMEAGFVPYVMVYRGEKSGAYRSPAWDDFRKRWRGNSSVFLSICVERRKDLLRRLTIFDCGDLNCTRSLRER